MPRLLIAVPLLSLMLSACALGPGVHSYRTPFDESQFRPYAEEGTASITGQTFVTTRDGRTLYAAGNEVALIPVTDYTREWYQEGVVAGRAVERFDPDIHKYLRLARADVEGRFEFKRLPAGQYYVASDMSWKESDGGVQHATACALVVLEQAENAEVKVTRP